MEHDEIFKVLTRKNSLRAVLRSLDYDQIEKLTDDILHIRDELEAEKRKEAEAEEARRAKIEEVRKMMVEAGIQMDELAGVAVPKKQVKPKYRHIEQNTGKALEWSGRGRTPIWIREYEERGGNRADLEIK